MTTILLSKKTIKLYLDEKKVNCVVCSKSGMKDANMEQVSITDAMIRDTKTATWKTIQVNCIRHKDPKNKFLNTFATHVMGTEIIGHAVLLSKSHLTSEMIDKSMNPPKLNSWSAVAKQLPSLIPLTEEEKTRKAAELTANKQKLIKPKIIHNSFRENEPEQEQEPEPEQENDDDPWFIDDHKEL